MAKRLWFKTVVVLLMVAFCLSACSGSSSDPYVNLKEPLTVSVGADPAVIGSLDQYGVEITIPAGAVTGMNSFRLQKAEGPPDSDPAVGQILNIPVDIDMDGDIKRFDEPILIAFKLTQDQWDTLEHPRDIHIGYFDGYSWVYLDPHQVDPESLIVTFKTYHCSYIYPSKAEKEEMKRQMAKSMAVEDVTIDKKASLREATESMVKSVMGPQVDKSFLQDVVEGIMDQHDASQLIKATANQNWQEAETQFLSVFTQVCASNLWAYAQNADALGDLGANLGLIGSFGTSASHLADGNYEEVAKELARGIISTHPVGKLLTSAVNVTERQIARWKNAEIEAAYQIFLNGKEPSIPFWGYGSIEAGDFDEIWNQMRGVGRQIIVDAVSDFTAENGREPTPAEKAAIERDAKKTLEQEFKDRQSKEKAIAEAESKNLEFLNIMEAGNLLTRDRYGYDPEQMSYKERAKQLMELRNKVLVDTNRRMNFGGLDSETELNVYTVGQLITEYVSKGEDAYNDMLVNLGLVEVLDSRSLAGTYSVPLVLTKSTLSREEASEDGKSVVNASATASVKEAVIEVAGDGTVSIAYAIQVRSESSNTIQYNPEYTGVDRFSGEYTIEESFNNLSFSLRPGAHTELTDVNGEMTYSGTEVHPHDSWDTQSTTALTCKLEKVSARVEGKKLIITGNTIIDLDFAHVGGFTEGFPATFQLIIDTGR